MLGNANLMVTGPYEIPNAQVDSYAVTTNNVPGGAFRGFGRAGAFSRRVPDEQAGRGAGHGPVELRLKNVLREQPADDADAHPARRQHGRSDRGCGPGCRLGQEPRHGAADGRRLRPALALPVVAHRP
ncbi:MAG: molybdopterin-dependent oxidoreductase [Candidatus Promineofilum sp.]|nr:molybdopterin-dependent oxidoreductase [Promineifilum sp.]